MDNSVADIKYQIDTIKESILDGLLSHVEMHRVLVTEFDKELKKPIKEVDMAYVNACVSLLDGINQSKAVLVQSHADKNYAAIQRKLIKHKHISCKKAGFRSILVAICLIVIFVATDILLTHDRIDTFVSPDEQQYIIQGTVVAPNIMDSANADNDSEEVLHCSTKDFNEMVEFLGIEPAQPTWIPEGWSLNMYEGYLSDGVVIYGTSYTNENSEYLLRYDAAKYENIQLARHEYEQEKIGTMFAIDNKQMVYIADNLDTKIAVWIEGDTVFSVGGPLAEDVLIKIINSIN